MSPINRLTCALFSLTLASVFAGCAPGPAAADRESDAERPKLGLMTSLPLYWPLGAGVSDIAGGELEKPWQRRALEERYQLVPLDTLTPIPALSPDDPETDPLAGLDRVAIIQPRGLSPADNVALDNWVRAGGQLLIALDPMLTGEYELPIGDPRRPIDTALIPPVVERWGLAVSYNPEQGSEVTYAELPGGPLPLVQAGEGKVVAVVGEENSCITHESKSLARCDAIGEGTVTAVYDAAAFEHVGPVGEDHSAINALLDYAFQ
ncbi:MAG: hypothetical protein AAGK02_04790 [Pseudomonadota bacterium]